MGGSCEPGSETIRVAVLKLEAKLFGWQLWGWVENLWDAALRLGWGYLGGNLKAGGGTVWVAVFRLGVKLFGSQS